MVLERQLGEISLHSETAEINGYLESISPSERARWAIDSFGIGGVAVITSLGPKGAVVPHLVSESIQDSTDRSELKIYFVDTGYYPPSTLEMRDELEERGINIRTLVPLVSAREIDDQYPQWDSFEGTPLFDGIVWLVKHEPLERELGKLGSTPKVIITGANREQSSERAAIPIISMENGVYHLNITADIPLAEIDNYIAQNNLPTNPWHYDITKGRLQKLECKIITVGLPSSNP